MDAANLQSTFEMRTIFRMEHIEPTYDCGRFVPTNGVNFTGSPVEFPFTPKEIWQARYWRLSQTRSLLYSSREEAESVGANDALG